MKDEIWWERRRDNEPTNEYLARVLEEVGLSDMANRARLYHFDDYFAPDEIDQGDNSIRLVNELNSHACCATRDNRLRIRVIKNAAADGEFDGTKEEESKWYQSEEGQSAEREYGALARDIMGQIRKDMNGG